MLSPNAAVFNPGRLDSGQIENQAVRLSRMNRCASLHFCISQVRDDCSQFSYRLSKDEA